MEVMNMQARANELDTEIKATVQLVDDSLGHLIELLLEMNDANLYYYFGCESLRDYVQKAGLYKLRMGYYLEKIIDNKVLAQYIVNNRAEAQEIGLTRFIELANSGVVDQDNVDQWVNSAKIARTIKELKEQLGVNGGDHPCSFHCNFSNKEEYAAFLDCIERVRRYTGVENTASILNFMVAEMVTSHPELFTEE